MSKEFILKLNFEKVVMLVKGKKEIQKSPDGEDNFVQNDLMGINSLLQRFNPREYQLRDYRSWTSIKDKCRKAMLKSKKELVLSMDEASFLKAYLQDLPEKEKKSKDERTLVEFEIKTLLSVLDQFKD